MAGSWSSWLPSCCDSGFLSAMRAILIWKSPTTLIVCWNEWAEDAGRESCRVTCTDALSSRRRIRSHLCSPLILCYEQDFLTFAVFSQDRCEKVALLEEVSCQIRACQHAVLHHTSEVRTAATLHSSAAQTLPHQQVCSWFLHYFTIDWLTCIKENSCKTGLLLAFVTKGSFVFKGLISREVLPRSHWVQARKGCECVFRRLQLLKQTHHTFLSSLSLTWTNTSWPPACSSFRRSKYDVMMEYVSDILQQTPGQFATLITLREQLVSISM